MAFVHFGKREVHLKIVYYGPGLCGKTTNLQTIHHMIRPDAKGNMVSVATAGDRTIFFDFMPLKAEAIQGFSTHFQLYTVPGQPRYNETRRLVLQSVDGVVFVADSQWDKMGENADSFENLEENLQTLGRSVEHVPYMLQYNKRDLENIAPVEYMDFLLNNRETRQAALPAVATTGEGVFECLNMVCRLVLHNFIAEHREAGASAEQEMVLT